MVFSECNFFRDNTMDLNKNFETLFYTEKNSIGYITLNRPDVHNAFNGDLINELFDIFKILKELKDLRIIVLTGNGKSFCAGADLNWMKSVVNYSYRQNFEESLKLAELMNLIFTHPKPVIARVNGSAIGGGVGLMAACDIVIASDNAKFGLTEVKLGLAPSVISPYVISRIGVTNARDLFITGERITAHKAFAIKLVNQVVGDEELDNAVNQKINMILSSGPDAVKAIKELIFNVTIPHFEQIRNYTSELIANLRLSSEGQEGMNSYLEKRKPYWSN